MPSLRSSDGWRPRRGATLRLARRDNGAVATVFTILLASGVLLGMLALTVDVGRLYAEREELQSGADAAVMRIAQQCAKATTAADCDKDQLLALAKDMAEANARDGYARVSQVCGEVPVNGLIANCDPPIGNYTDCLPGQYTEDRPYLEVRTETQTGPDEYLLSPSFAQMLLGNGGYAGTTVRACARATWGSLLAGDGMAVTFSTCEWEDATTDNLGDRVYGEEVALKLHDTNTQTCPAGPSGWDDPGGFGWLDESGACLATVEVDSTVGSNTGVPPSKSCKDLLPQWREDATVLLVPIHSGVDDAGAPAEYYVDGLAAFVVTGYYLPGLEAPSILTGEHYCSGQEKCIYGYFTQDLVPATGPLGDPDEYGVIAVTLIG